jgi:hypothetical protein
MPRLSTDSSRWPTVSKGTDVIDRARALNWHRAYRAFIVWLTACALLVTHASGLSAPLISPLDPPVTPPATHPAESLPTCPDPGLCFQSTVAQDEWARKHQCVFKDVECEDTEKSDGGVVATAKAAGRFVEGLIDGLKQQVVDLWHFFEELFTNPSEVWEGLKTLGKMVIEDPKAAAQLFLDLLGDDAGKLIHCGAYDQGKVIGKYVSPFFALKVARLVANGAKLAGSTGARARSSASRARTRRLRTGADPAGSSTA